MQNFLSYIKRELNGLYSDSEIQSFGYLILQHICKKDKHTLLRDKDNDLSLKEYSLARKFIEELKLFRPIQYILGQTEFYGLSFIVDENVLIPRAETEELVELVLASKPHKHAKILDIGTGSGCIAISLAKHLPEIDIYALDVSKEALATSITNAKIHNVKIHTIQEDILNTTRDKSLIYEIKWDIIVSNPPYIVPSEKEVMSKNVLEYEPPIALFVPESQPLLFYETIADIGLTQLNKNGKIFFEINALFGKETAGMLKRKGYSSVELHKDISGKDRIIKAVAG